MSFAYFYVCLAIGTILVLAQVCLAYRDDMFSVQQMREKGIQYGLPFTGHGGMWGDIFLITPLCAWIGALNQEVEVHRGLLIIGIGFLASFALHFGLYTKGDLPSLHCKNGRLTMAGWVHAIYMAWAIQVFVMLYFCIQDPPSRLVIITSIILPIHVLLGNHVPLSLFRPKWFPVESHHDWRVLAQVGVVSILVTWRAYALLH